MKQREFKFKNPVSDLILNHSIVYEGVKGGEQAMKVAEKHYADAEEGLSNYREVYPEIIKYLDKVLDKIKPWKDDLWKGKKSGDIVNVQKAYQDTMDLQDDFTKRLKKLKSVLRYYGFTR